jgi:small-conductance mechanosensitive channel
MTKTFKIGDRVSWNSEAGRVSGTVIRVHTVSRAVERTEHILCRPVLGGLHHQYIRI